MIPLETRRLMVERDEGSMSICYQCELLGIARSSLYYTPSKTSNKDLQLMEELDKLYLEDPTRRTRRMTNELRKIGYHVGRCLYIL
jgi:putative transposase